MRFMTLAVGLTIGSVGPVLAQPHAMHHAATPAGAAVMPRMPSQPAFEMGKVGDPSCAGVRLLSRASFVRADDRAVSVRCGQPLSTDTLMMVHHWNQT